MSNFTLSFAGQIKKSEERQVGEDLVVEAQLCRQNTGRKTDTDKSFTWIRVSIWKPPEWMRAKLVTGAFIAGVGRFSLRSYEVQGQKRQAAEVRCTSFDIDVAGGADEATPHVAPRRPAAAPPAAPAGNGDDEPPF